MASPRVVFIGSKRAGLQVLKAIATSVSAVVTFDDRHDPRSAYPEFLSFARQNTLTLKVVSRADSEAELLALAPDLCIVCGWYWILGTATLAQISRGVVGIHHSLLPRYRGGAPVVWALINGDARTGTTLFHFSEGMDSGDIIDQRTTDISESDYVSGVLLRLEQLDVEMVRDNIELLVRGTASRRVQDDLQATYCSQRSEEDGRIDWSWEARRVRNFIRAQSDPYPGAWTLMKEQRLTLCEADIFPRPYFGHPGRVAQVGDNGVVVCCGDNTAVSLSTLQLTGRRLPAQDVIRSIQVRLG